MPTREQILDAIDAGYAARTRADKAALADFWAPGAVFDIAGEMSLLPPFPKGPAAAGEAVGELIDLIRFHDYRRLDAIVEGNRAALRWEIDFSIGTSPVTTTQISEYWEFDDDCRATSLLQFVDTALLGKMLTEARR